MGGWGGEGDEGSKATYPPKISESDLHTRTQSYIATYPTESDSRVDDSPQEDAIGHPGEELLALGVQGQKVLAVRVL